MAAETAMEDAKVQPLVIFYDSEAANGNVYSGDIIEIAAKCHPDVLKGSFQSLINTKQPLCAFGKWGALFVLRVVERKNLHRQQICDLYDTNGIFQQRKFHFTSNLIFSVFCKTRESWP